MLGRRRRSPLPSACSSCMSAPAQKPRPAPVTTIARTRSSSAHCSSSPKYACSISAVHAFRRSGRLSVNSATPSSISICTTSLMLAPSTRSLGLVRAYPRCDRNAPTATWCSTSSPTHPSRATRSRCSPTAPRSPSMTCSAWRASSTCPRRCSCSPPSAAAMRACASSRPAWSCRSRGIRCSARRSSWGAHADSRR